MTSSGDVIDPALAAAFAAWAAEPRLAALRDPRGAWVVLDDAGRALAASPAGAPLAGMIGTGSIAVLARRIAGTDAGPSLARLRLDPRRIASPTLSLLAGGTDADGRALLLVVAVDPLPRARVAPAVDRPASPATGQTPPKFEALRLGDRFLWRSDASGILTAFGDARGGLEALAGQDWAGLSASGRLTGAEALLAALAERRTFRAASATFDLAAGMIEIDLSGAPAGRGEAGFAGFGVVRRLPASTSAESEARQMSLSAVNDMTADVPAEPVPLPAIHQPAPEPAPVGDAALTVDEHAAFREIARALGARYAGDDEALAPAQRASGGSVTPFPGVPDTAPRSGAPTADPTDTVLTALPVPALICRGDAVLAANRAMLDLTGYGDGEALFAAGLRRVLPGAAPGHEGPRRTVIETAGGRTRPVEAAQGDCVWAGEPASCLVLIPVAEDASEAALVAERLAREAQAARALRAEAALDAVAGGVVTLDGAGRMLALNRAAAALIACDHREVVGEDFSRLFREPETVGAVLRRADGSSPAVTRAGRAVRLTLAPPRPDGQRVAILEARVDEPAAPRLPETGAPWVPEATVARVTPAAQLDEALRLPLATVVETAGAILGEPYGALGDPRYRERIGGIQDTAAATLARLDEILDIAAVEAGRIDLAPRALALNDVVAGCVAELQPEATRGRIVLRTSFSAGLGDLEADEPSVARAASLVIGHAIRRSQVGGQVIVSTGSADSTGVTLRVRDAASPRTEAPAPDRPDGLALPRALVEANGGRLNLSRPAEDGTLVEIVLPTARAARA